MQPTAQVKCDFTFDVPVDLFFRVQVVKAFQDLLQHGGNLRLIEWTRPQLDNYKHIHTDYMQVKSRSTVPMCHSASRDARA